MQFPDVLIDGRSRLGTAVTFRVVEIPCGDSLFAENAFEGDAAVHRLCGVIAHKLHCSSSGRERFRARGVGPSIDKPCPADGLTVPMRGTDQDGH
jgi:hypothetical protein